MAIKQQIPTIKVIGVEPELESDAYQSMIRGERVSLSKSSNSIADAIKILTLGDLTYPLICKYVDEMVIVSEEQIARAMVTCLSEGHLLVEPSGALSVAAALCYSNLLKNKPIICVASGGNTTLPIFLEIINQFHIKI